MAATDLNDGKQQSWAREISKLGTMRIAPVREDDSKFNFITLQGRYPGTHYSQMFVPGPPIK